MRSQVRVCEVAQVNGFCAVVGVLVGAGAANAGGGVGACVSLVLFFLQGLLVEKGWCSSGLPVTMTTLSLTRLEAISMQHVLDRECTKKGTYGPTESDATVRILGISSNLPASGIPSTNCWLTAWRRRLATPDIVQRDR
jgi:hypothetical protein